MQAPLLSLFFFTALLLFSFGNCSLETGSPVISNLKGDAEQRASLEIVDSVNFLHHEASVAEEAPVVRAPDLIIPSKSKNMNRHVPVSTVAILTFLMAAATGLGALPFFFFKLEPSWQGICNGIACGVMLAASFDLIAEGKVQGDSGCVIIGILLGGLFIVASQKVLNQFGEVSIMDLKGADARRMILIIAILTLHSIGEGSGVGVSFVGPKGLSQGLLVTFAIAVHNVPEGLAVAMLMSSRGFSAHQAFVWSVFTSLPQFIVAVPSFLCAEAFSQFLPLCMGFAAGCMIWIVFGEVMPDSLKDADASHVASAATMSVAVMEGFEIIFMKFEGPLQWERFSPMIWSLLFVLGPFLGGAFVVMLSQVMPLRSTILSGVSSGIMLVISLWRPVQLFYGNKMSLLTIITLLWSGSFLYFTASHFAKRLIQRLSIKDKDVIYQPRKSHRNVSQTSLIVTLACCTVTGHAFMEGLMLGVAAPKAEGLGAYMLLPVSLHGFPRGIALAASMYGICNSWKSVLFGSGIMALASPLGAVLSMMAGLDYRGLDYWMLLACGSLLPAVLHVLYRPVKLDNRGTVSGLCFGVVLALLGFSATRLLCMHTPYCRSAPEAVT